MQFGLLGDLVVVDDDGVRIPIPAPKRRTLLAALLLDADRPVGVDRLTDALWGDAVPVAAEVSLHAHVSRLRREVGAGRIRTASPGYLLALDGDELDVRRFEVEIAQARQAADAGRWAEATAIYAAALSRWRGPALADVPCNGAMAAEAVRLEELHLGAVEGRFEAELALGRHAEIIPDLESVIARHPLRERAWSQLMLALYRSGRQADALAAYRRLRVRLVQDLGIDPSPELQALEGRILRQDQSLAGPTLGSVQPAVRLPQPVSSLVGRHEELERSAGILRQHRMLTLTGPGGVGKTRLAVLVAHALVPEFRDGVLFVDLSSVREPSQVMGRIGELTGGGERPAAVIGDRRMLLVLDNFEQVLEAAADVADLLEVCRQLHLLVTSRAPLRIAAERRLEVPPLSPQAGAMLFEERAQAAIAAGPASGVVDDIVGRLDGLPLAIELAASRLRLMSPEMLRARLTERLPLLTAGARDAPERHRTLRETIAWSHDLLPPPARRAFRRLAVLAGGFDLTAALVVAETDIEVLAELVDQSLLRRVDDRYSMLETIREYASERLSADDDLIAARDRHLRHYLAVATGTDRGTTEGGPLSENAWIAMCANERDNLRLAFEWAVETGDDDAVATLYRAIGMNWLLIGAVDEGMRWGRLAVAATRRIGDARRRISALAMSSEFPRFSGDLTTALALKTEALELARAIDDPQAVAMILDDTASIHAAEGDFDLARTLVAEARAIRDRTPSEDEFDRAHTVITEVEVALAAGEIATAQQLIEELTEIEGRIAVFPDWEVDSACLRAKVLHAAGEDATAEAALRGVVRDAVDIGFRMPLVDSLDILAAIAAAETPTRAARLQGAADRMRAEARLGFWDRAEYERTVANLRADLGDETFERLHAEGHAHGASAIPRLIAPD